MSSITFQSQFDELIAERAHFKQRSHDTHFRTHLPELEMASTTAALSEVPPQIDIVLLGSSSLERFKTTGQHTGIGQLRYPQLFNAGVGGDKIENVLYRINLGLLRLLKPRNPKVVVLLVGTNNLQPKQALQHEHLDDFDLLLQALLRTLSERTQILVLGFCKRKDVDEQYISQSNAALKKLVGRVGLDEIQRHEQQDGRVHWMEPPEEIRWEHLEDHVHLNAEGYQILDAILYPRLRSLLTAYDST